MFLRARINGARDLLLAEILNSRERTKADIAEIKSMLQAVIRRVDEINSRLARVEKRLGGH
jgi:hypothetical protein